MPPFIFPQSSTSKRSEQFTIFVMLCTLIAGCSSPNPSIEDDAARFVVQVTDRTFRREVLEADEPVLVDMWAPWCRPCVDMKPALREAGKRLRGEIKVAEVNVQNNPFVDEKYGIAELPTLMVFVDGKLVARDVGSRSIDGLLKLVGPYRWEEGRSMDGQARHVNNPIP